MEVVQVRVSRPLQRVFGLVDNIHEFDGNVPVPRPAINVCLLYDNTAERRVTTFDTIVLPLDSGVTTK
jgi:hypothetical protein